MALKVLNQGYTTLGQFDGYDQDVLLVKGGEILQFDSVSLTGSDKAASDSFDGYVNNASPAGKRPVLRLAYDGKKMPIMLADDGVSGYGTAFGTVVGGVAGQTVTGGAALGPHTATGSGKLTAHDKAGLYAVSLDACDLATDDTTLSAGTPLYFYIDGDKQGQLCTYLGAEGSVSSIVAGYFVSFETSGSLVNTPNHLVAPLNGGGAADRNYAYAVFHFNPLGSLS
jgi:hypothetical protein